MLNNYWQNAKHADQDQTASDHAALSPKERVESDCDFLNYLQGRKYYPLF